MLSKTEISHIVERTLKELDSIDIEFRRGNPEKYFENITQINLGLTIPNDDLELLVEAIYLKNLYVLWNILVDDESDIDKTNNLLNISLNQISSLKSPELSFCLIPKILKPFEKSKFHSLLRFDLLNIINGFFYEHQINTINGLSSIEEYLDYSTMTATIKHYLDIDYGLFKLENLHNYNSLRIGYHYYSIALKLASDIGTYHREKQYENSLNSIAILDGKGLKDSKSEVKILSKKYLKKALSSISTIKDFNTVDISGTMEDIVLSYLSGEDQFFQDETALSTKRKLSQ